jgi:hypothetical protein
MKNTLLILGLLVISTFSKAQAVRITVNENTKEGIKPLTDVKFDITFNDTIKTEMTTGSDGSLGKFPLPAGKYKLVITNPSFEMKEPQNIIVEEKRTNQISVICVKKSDGKK